MRSITILLFILLFSTGCEKASEYSDTRLWYDNANQSGSRDFDVFYLLPSCVRDKVVTVGDTIHYADPLCPGDREAMLPSLELAGRIFGKDANFYSPYYSQISLESWRSDSLVRARFPRSIAQVREAFAYYMEHMNQGRPFVLAGYSQGAKCVVELLKTLTAEQYRRMVAAYVVGYRITASDTLDYKYIKPATGETDTGVTICFNSVSGPEAISPALSPNAVCINPLSWKTAAEKAQLNDSVTVSVDTLHHVLTVSGFRPDDYYVPSLDFLFRKGNYHLQELYFYKKELSDNIKLRFKTYRSAFL